MKRPEALNTLREQKGDGSMYGITTAEQKAALVTAGWKPRDAGTYEAWEKGEFIASLYGDDLRNIGHMRQKDVPLAVAVEVAAILGIAPAGHVTVSVEQLAEWAQRLEGTWPNSFTEGDVAEEIRAALKR